jgi:hypothetical protein
MRFHPHGWAAGPWQTQNVIPGLTVTFGDGGKGGIFNPSMVVTDQTGSASTSYTLPKRSSSYALTASAPGCTVAGFTETALPGPAKWLFRWSGNNQSAPVTTPLPAPLVTKAQDSYGNGVPGVIVSYSDTGASGTFTTKNPVSTDTKGLAPVNYTTSAHPGTGTIRAGATGVSSKFHVHSPVTFEQRTLLWNGQRTGD